MTRRRAFALMAAVITAGSAAAQDFVELTFDSMPDAAQLAAVEAAFDITAALIIDDITHHGFSSRVVAVRPGNSEIAVAETIDLPPELTVPGDDQINFLTVFRNDGGLDVFAQSGHRIQPLVPDPFGDGTLFGGQTMTGNAFLNPDGSISLDPGPTIGAMAGALNAANIGRDLTLEELEDLFGDVTTRGYLIAPATVEPDPPAIIVDVTTVAPDTVAMLPGNAGYVRPVTGDPLQVTQGLPAGAVLQQAAFGVCAPPTENWPFSPEAVIDTIRFADAVMADSGFDTDIRARVLIVDSGLPRALIDNPAFRRVLDVNRLELLAGGPYLRSAEDGDRPTGCSDPDQDRAATAFGYIPRADTQGTETCIAADPYAMIAPPIPTKPIRNYEPAHGAIVATLAAGGPGLIETYDDLGTHVGVSVARNVRISTAAAGEQTVLSDVTDAADLIQRAASPFQGAMAEQGDIHSRRFDVLNLSLSIPPTAVSADWQGQLKLYSLRGGLVVVAAGNGTTKLTEFDGFSSDRPSLIESVSHPQGVDHAIVVGGTQLSRTGAVELYPESNWSSNLVDIAAPATGVPSYGLDGGLACVPGTSIATPQVSFVAAMLVSLGLWSNAEVKRRILATADIEPALKDFVRNGRNLNVVNALDVFADLVWEIDPSAPARIGGTPRRLVLLGAGDVPADIMLQFCQGALGYIDTSQLLLWERRPGGEAEVWRAAPLSALGTTCLPGQGGFRAFDLDRGTVEPFDLANISRIVPSRFRFGAGAMRVATSTLAAGAPPQ